MLLVEFIKRIAIVFDNRESDRRISANRREKAIKLCFRDLNVRHDALEQLSAHSEITGWR